VARIPENAGKVHCYFVHALFNGKSYAIHHPVILIRKLFMGISNSKQ